MVKGLSRYGGTTLCGTATKRMPYLGAMMAIPVRQNRLAFVWITAGCSPGHDGRLGGNPACARDSVTDWNVNPLDRGFAGELNNSER